MEVIIIAILFSQVTISANNEESTFFVSGIPREYDDLEGWNAFDGFLFELQEETEVQIKADAFLYGEGETFKATPEEVAYIMKRIELNNNFLNSRCDHFETVDFNIQWSPEELFGHSFTT